jgi:hypothetical protein
MVRIVRVLCPVLLGIGVFAARGVWGEGEAGKALAPEQQEALSLLLKSLETLKANPGSLDSIQKLVSQTEAQARAELESLEDKLEELRQSLAEAEEGRDQLKGRMDALQVARALLADPTLGKGPALASAESPPSTPAKAPEPAPSVQIASIDFNRDIRPILANNCFACHGPDEKVRKAGLRFDDGVGGYTPLRSGNCAIAPGDKTKSALFDRITAADPGDRMPPAEFGKVLKPAEVELLGRWIDQGGKWVKHWSLIKPERRTLPQVKNTSWPKNAIDSFILARLEQEGLAPSPEADRRALLRRVTLDLTGLPPTLPEVDAFLADTSPDAYEKAVDRLLASPRYGEHMARYWLDVSRYADTNGYHIDNERFMWRWRDWVIDAFNRNMPFDKFAVEQLAGDLLPGASLEARLASGFNRNHMITFEGGAIPEEYRTQYVIDRVNTTGTAFMGMTVGCAQCHDHKFDPLTQKEYYQLFAFFNTQPENGLDGRAGNAVPLMKAPLPDQAAKLDEMNKELADLDGRLDKPMPELDNAQPAWEAQTSERLRARWTVLEPASLNSTGGSTLKQLEDKSVLAEGNNPDQDVYELTARTTVAGISAIRLEVLADDSLPNKGVGRSDNANFVLTEFETEMASPSTPDTFQKVAFAQATADYSQKDFEIEDAIDGDPKTGWAVDSKPESRVAVFVAKQPFGTDNGTILRIRLKHESSFAKHSIGRFRISVSNSPDMTLSKSGSWYYNGPYPAKDGYIAYDTAYAPEKEVNLGETYEDGRSKWSEREDLEDGKKNDLGGDICATYLYRVITAPATRTAWLALSSNDAMKLWVNGELIIEDNDKKGLTPDLDRVPVSLKQGENQILMKVVNFGNAYTFSFKVVEEQVGEMPIELERALAQAAVQRSEQGAKGLRAIYRRANSREWRWLDEERNKKAKAVKDFEDLIPTAMVMQEMDQARDTFILTRGQYDQPADKVEAKLPAAFPPLPEGAPTNRLGLAEWLVDPSHPLTARVTVNRYWQQYFGTGIVMTSEDFGSQGEQPSHPELLDWLATEFVRSGWDIKALQRLIVTSAAYRQSSKVTPGLLEKDPGNRLLAHGPRFRMDAEMVRDNALAISGLLVEKAGGSSVRPYQPPGLWEEMAYGDGFSAQIYVQDHGDALYRRSMYTFWKRQVPPPAMLIFDGPIREVCIARRARTNTPLQALALLDDPQYVEASRALAQRILKEAGPDPVARASYGFCLATARPPTEAELGVLLKVCSRQLEEFRNKPEEAAKLLAVGESKRDESIEPAEHAAWTTVASMILNMDETVTKG